MEFLALIAAVVALIWIAIALTRGGLLVGCVIVLLAGCVFGAFLFSLPTKPIPLTTDRVLWLVLLLQFAVYRRWGLTEPRPLGRADKVLLALLAVLAFSTLINDWTAHNNQPVARLIFQWIMPAGLYFVAREARLSERGLRGLAIFFGLFAVYLSLTALAEIHEAWWAVYPQYIRTPEFDFFGRGRGPLLNPAGNGFCIAVGLAAWFLLWPQAKRGGKLATFVLTAICLVGIYATLTRCAWMGAGAARESFWCWPRPRPGGCRFSVADCCWQVCSWRRSGKISFPSRATNRLPPRVRPIPSSCDRSWPTSPGRCSAIGRYWAAGSPTTWTNRSTTCTIAQRPTGWKSAALRAAQRPAVAAHGDRRHGDGPFCRPADLLEYRGLAALALCRGATLDPPSRTVLPRRDRRLCSQRDVSGHVVDSDGQLPVVLHGRGDRRPRTVDSARRICPGSNCAMSLINSTAMPVARASKSPSTRGRMPGLDLARLVAAYAIIWLHAPHIAELEHSRAIGRFAVPLFVMITILMVFESLARNPQQELSRYARSRFVRLYLPFMAWNGIYLAFKLFKGRLLPGEPNDYPAQKSFGRARVGTSGSCPSSWSSACWPSRL